MRLICIQAIAIISIVDFSIVVEAQRRQGCKSSLDMEIHISLSYCTASVVSVCWYNETCTQAVSSPEDRGLSNHLKEKIPKVFTRVLSNLLIKKSTSIYYATGFCWSLGWLLKAGFTISLRLQSYLECG